MSGSGSSSQIECSIALSMLLLVPGLYSSYPSNNKRTLWLVFPSSMASMLVVSPGVSFLCWAMINLASDDSLSTYRSRSRKTKSNLFTGLSLADVPAFNKSRCITYNMISK